MNNESTDFRFDVGFSFAGEDRDIVEAIATECRDLGVSVFYDKFAEAELWGKDLYDYLSELYSNACRYCVVFVSQAYVKKDWTRLERRRAQSRALVSQDEYILPVRLDDSALPGLLDTTGFIDLRDRSPSALAQIICQKLGRDRLPRDPSRIVIELKSDQNFFSNADMKMHNLHYGLLEILGFEEARIIGCEQSPHRVQLSISVQAHSQLRNLFLSGELTEKTGATWASLSSLEGKETAPPPRQVPLARLRSGGSGRNVVCHGGSIAGLESEAWRAWDYLGNVHNKVSKWRALRAFITEKDGLVYVHSNYKKPGCEDTSKIATDSSVDLFELFINLVFLEWPGPSKMNEAREIHERFAQYAVEIDHLGLRGDEFYAGAMNIEFLRTGEHE